MGTLKRRSFLAGILAASVSPAIVRAASLMPVKVMDSGIVVPDVQELVLSSVDAESLENRMFIVTSVVTSVAHVGIVGWAEGQCGREVMSMRFDLGQHRLQAGDRITVAGLP